MNKDSHYFNSLINNSSGAGEPTNHQSASLHSSPLHSSSIYHPQQQQQQQSENNKFGLNSSSVLLQYQNSAYPANIINPFMKTLEYIGAKTPNTPSAALVSYRLQKLINAEKKALKKRHEFLNSTSQWINILPNGDNKRLLVEYSRVAEMQGRLDEEMTRKKENISLQLKHVSQRETKADELKAKRVRTFRQLREQERKSGESQTTCLSKEALEELNISIDVVEEQLVKSINTSLKGSLVDYVLSLQGVSTDIKEGCNEFFEYMNTDAMYNFRKSYLLGGDNNSDDKIQYLGSSRTASENKENELKEPVKPLAGKKKKYMNLINPTAPTDLSAVQEQNSSYGHHHSEESVKCPDCSCLLQDENTVHLPNCAFGIKNAYKKSSFAGEPPGSSQSLSMPGRLGIRIPSALRSRAGGTEGWS